LECAQILGRVVIFFGQRFDIADFAIGRLTPGYSVFAPKNQPRKPSGITRLCEMYYQE
jgi:hypothetical protein